MFYMEYINDNVRGLNSLSHDRQISRSFPRDMGSDSSYHSEIWQASRQQYWHSYCQIAKGYDHVNNPILAVPRLHEILRLPLSE